jgi:hypothetical protein
MLYASIKTGVAVHIGDMGLNVLIDLVNYAAEIDAAAISGKKITKTAPQSLADMTKSGRTRA